MNLFRALLVVMILTLLGYTGLVLMERGADLFSVFFGDVAAVTWAGQFDLDFSCFLLLSGLWLAWRHHFVSLQAKGDVKELLIVKARC